MKYSIYNSIQTKDNDKHTLGCNDVFSNKQLFVISQIFEISFYGKITTTSMNNNNNNNNIVNNLAYSVSYIICI